MTLEENVPEGPELHYHPVLRQGVLPPKHSLLTSVYRGPANITLHPKRHSQKCFFISMTQSKRYSYSASEHTHFWKKREICGKKR